MNAKRVYRLWRREGLKVPQKKRKRRRLGTQRERLPSPSGGAPRPRLVLGFYLRSDHGGSPLKWLSIEDEYTRESLALKVDRSITSEDVIDTLAELFAMRGVPGHIRRDNGPEFIAQAIRRWLAQLEVETLYIEPGAPWENGYAESFHSRFRDEFLATEEFENLVAAARRLTAAWRKITTITGRTARWGTGPQPSSRPAVLLPLRSCFRLRLKQLLRSSSTADLPNPYSHNTWYRIWGQASVLSRRPPADSPPSSATLAALLSLCTWHRATGPEFGICGQCRGLLKPCFVRRR